MTNASPTPAELTAEPTAEPTTPYDLLVIGGGINGAGIARDAAGRGAKVMLVEKDDLASHTSSASTKLVHGGLRYLEQYDFRLVRESLIERERLLNIAPHIIWPMRFILPHDKGLRPAWMLRLGLFIYDHIGGRKLLPATQTVDLRQPGLAGILQDRLVKGFAYADCWVEDARLVVLNALDAALHGADIRTRTACTALHREGGLWHADLASPDGATATVTARAVINAAGPWVDDVLNRANPGSRHENLRLVKGSHLIFPRLYDGDHAYIFQNGDGRIVFAIPYEGAFTLVGTTDVAFEGDPGDIAISDAESAYICDAVNEYLTQPVTPADAVWSYAGVRPLYEDHSAKNSTVTRDYTFDLDAPDGQAPILSIFGGKITTFRKLAEHALAKLVPLGIVKDAPWTEGSDLPGGGFDPSGFPSFVDRMCSLYPWADRVWMRRVCRAYGSEAQIWLADAKSYDDLGDAFAAGLTESEIIHLLGREYALTADDILWRRTKLGLHMTVEERAKVHDWIETLNLPRGLTKWIEGTP
ncbi:MAG: glycerol-3-phosphate dehydrogenase [Pontixanthobacter sp.]